MIATVPPVFVIAEAGVNHNGDLALALRLCDAARQAGADAVKFQTFRAEDPQNSRKHASLILDIDPTNVAALRYL